MSSNFYTATANLPPHILLIDAVSSPAPITAAPTARTMRRPPHRCHRHTQHQQHFCSFVLFCFVLVCFGYCSLLLFHFSKSCCWDVVYQIFTVTFSTCRHDLHVPHAAAFQVLPDHRTQQTCYSSEEFIKQVGLGAWVLTMHYDVRPPQLRVSSSCSHVPGKSVASVNVARKPRRIKQVAASITPHHFPPQHQLRRQL